MAVSPEQILQSAEELGNGAREIDRRNAASRAYYAAFHRCLPLVEGDVDGDFGVHRAVTNELYASMNRTLRTVGSLLEQCKSIRVAADYKTASAFNKQRSDLALKLAQELLNKTDSFV